jgi:hypothetical protein
VLLDGSGFSRKVPHLIQQFLEIIFAVKDKTVMPSRKGSLDHFNIDQLRRSTGENSKITNFFSVGHIPGILLIVYDVN